MQFKILLFFQMRSPRPFFGTNSKSLGTSQCQIPGRQKKAAVKCPGVSWDDRGNAESSN